MKIEFIQPPNLTLPGEDSIRVMTPDEVAAEKSIFEASGNPLPNPDTSVFIGVFREGRRVAFLVLQLRLHAEPLFIEEGYSAVLPALVKKAEEYILEKAGPQYVYLFAPAGRTAQLAQAMGMQLEPWVILSKLVMPETPSKAAVLPLGNNTDHQPFEYTLDEGDDPRVVRTQ